VPSYSVGVTGRSAIAQLPQTEGERSPQATILKQHQQAFPSTRAQLVLVPVGLESNLLTQTKPAGAATLDDDTEEEVVVEGQKKPLVLLRFTQSQVRKLISKGHLALTKF